MNEWFNLINVTVVQVVPKLFEIITKQHLVLKAYEKQVDQAKYIVSGQTASKQGTSLIEQHLMGINYTGFTDKINNYYNFMKQQTKIQFDRFHAFEMLEQ